MSRPFHPLLLAVYSVLSPWAENLGELGLPSMLRPLAAVVLGTVLLWAGMTRLLRDARKGALAASSFLLLTFAHGGLVRAIAHARNDPTALSSAPLQTGLALALLAAWLGLVRLLGRRAMTLGVVTRYLNVASLLWLLLPAWNAVTRWPTAVAPALPALAAEAALPPGSKPPNIFYIVLDGYGGADALRDFFAYDNTEFLDGLARRGFRIAAHSHANYPQTSLSVPSALNMTYLDGVMPAGDHASQDRRFLTRLIDDSRLLRVLRRAGYRFVTFSSGVAITALREPDVTLSSPWFLTEFEHLLLNGSAFPSWLRLVRGLPGGRVLPDQFDAHRARIRFILDRLPAQAAAPGPLFVLAHVMCPHPPFVFEADGSRPAVVPTGPYGFFNDGANSRPRASYVDGYRKQVAFVNQRVDAAVAAILARAPSSIIIVQGDHGPGSMWDMLDAERTNVRERFSILNAYYFPDRDYREIYDTISPVNSFRVVLNHHFGTTLPLLEDRSYFATWDALSRFTDVTDRTR